jgi:hypothetical protein
LVAAIKDRHQTPDLQTGDKSTVLGLAATEKGPNVAEIIAGH